MILWDYDTYYIIKEHLDTTVYKEDTTVRTNLLHEFWLSSTKEKIQRTIHYFA